MTTLTFEQDPTDLAVVALFESLTNLNFHDGMVTDSDANAQTIGAPLPYVVYGGALGFDPNPRTGGRGPWVKSFYVRYVGATRASAQSVANTVRDFLDGHAVTVAGREYRIRLDSPDAPVVVDVDSTWTRPDGGPLFFANQRFNVF